MFRQTTKTQAQKTSSTAFAKTLMIALVAGYCTYAPPAAAEAPPAAAEAPPAVRITHADLNLNSEAGAAAFVRRVNRAARALCNADTPLPIELQQFETRAACREAVRAQALARIDAPLVVARLAPATPRAFAANARN